LSGVASSSSPATLGEGANQSVTGTVTDLAGNTASATVSGINIDETAPTISASATTADAQPYVSGTWTNQDVTVHFTTSDALSGIASSPADVTLSGEGAGQSVSGTAYDKAGNSASATFSDIRIDKTAPASSISLAGTAGSNGWYVSNVTVTLSAVDQASLSGVAATEYRINGGAWTTYTAPFTLTDGVYTVDYRSTDHAGNVETFKSQQVKVDTVAPAVTLTPDRSADHNGWYNHAVSFTVGATDSGSGVVSQTSNFTYSGPDSATAEVSATATDEAGNSTTVSFDFQYDATAPVTTVALVSGPTKNASGWYTGAVTVTLSAADQAGLSGVAATYCTVDGGGQQAGTTVALTDDGVHTIQYWSVDAAGNVEAAHTLTVKIDQTAPAINAVRDLLAYAAAHGGWNNADVTASYTASDAASGLASPDSGSYVFSTEGAGQSHTFTVYDVAGNSASATVDQVNIDKTPPTVSITAPGSAAHYLLNQAVAAIYSSADALAGIASSAGTVANGANIDTSSVGSHSFAVTAADKAGNTTTQTVTYYVDYNYGTGLFAPVTAGKAFKLGSTIPVKFQLKDANGNYISNLSAVLAIQLDGSAATATGGTSLRYDPTAQQFVFNLSTAGVKTEGSHTITVVLASGQTISVPITLRNSAGAALLVGTGADSGSATDGQLLAGDMALVVDNGGGNFTADQMARVQAAVAGLNDLLAPYGARITIVDAGAGVPANIVLHLAATTVIGGMTEGVLGVTQDTGDITLVAGWDWYAGADAAAVGAGQFDFQTVITHELGHALGLGHSADAASVMYPTLAAGQARRDIGVADLNVADDGGGADGLHAALAPDMGAAAAAGHSPVTAPTPAGFPIAGPATGDLWVALSSQGTGFLAGTAWGDAVRPALGGNPPSAAGLPAWATDLAFAGRLGTTWAEGSGAGRARGWDADLFGATEGGEGNPGGAEGPADAAARDGFFTACSVGDNREGTAALAARESDGGPASARDE
ncbi:MAG TPA: Ig-like domain-containing protein, partial [Gemmataceae bacterium]|nr:Ig-like domain-containing protein [Gemmataceae bacterium]